MPFSGWLVPLAEPWGTGFGLGFVGGAREAAVMSRDHDRFLELVLRNPVNRALLDRGSCLGVADWWLTAGAVFQTVWNCLGSQQYWPRNHRI